jgi:hypothetical protein
LDPANADAPLYLIEVLLTDAVAAVKAHHGVVSARLRTRLVQILSHLLLAILYVFGTWCCIQRPPHIVVVGCACWLLLIRLLLKFCYIGIRFASRQELSRSIWLPGKKGLGTEARMIVVGNRAESGRQGHNLLGSAVGSHLD